MTHYYLAATGGSDSNSGLSYAAPFATIGKLLSVMTAGDTGNFLQGSYGAINSDLNTIPAGTSWANAVTFRSYPGETATVERVRLFSASNRYVIFHDLIFDTNNTQDHCVHIGSGVDFIRVIACKIQESNAAGLFVTNASDGFCEIIGNYFFAEGCLVRSHDCVIEGNTFTGTTGHAIEISNTGSTNLNNNVIRRNYIYNCGNATNDNAIIVANGQNNLIAYNVIAECAGDGIELGIDALNTGVYNNTIYSCVGAGVNILATNDGGNTIRNNIIYSNGSTIVDGRGDAITSNNLTTNPNFVNATAGDFSLQAGSAAINAGIVISGLTVDFLQNPVPQGAAPDIGAFEYLLAGHSLTAETGLFFVNGQDTVLRQTHILPVATGIFALTGQPASLVYDTSVTNFLPASTGIFALTGQNAVLRHTHVLPVSTGVFALTGIAVALTRHFFVPAMPIFEGVTAFAAWIRETVSTLGGFPVYSEVLRKLPLIEESVGETPIYDGGYSTADDGRGFAPPALIGKRIGGELVLRASYGGITAQFFAALMGHEAFLIGNTVMPASLGSGVYRHIIELSPIYQDYWRMGDGVRMGQAIVMGQKKPQRGTYAVSKGVAIWEFAGMAPNRLTFTASREDAAVIAFDMVGSAHAEPASRNTSAVMAKTLPPLFSWLLPQHCTWSIGPYSTNVALTDANVMPGLPLTFTIDNQLASEYGPDAGFNPANISRDMSPPVCTAEFTVPTYSNDILYGYYRAGTPLMACAKWTGPAIPDGGGASYAFRVYFPACQIAEMSYRTTVGRNELRCVLRLYTPPGAPAGFPATNHRGPLFVETIGLLGTNQMA